MTQGSPEPRSGEETQNSEYCLKCPADTHVSCTAALHCWREVNVKLIVSLLNMRKKVLLIRIKGYFLKFLICIIRGMISFVLSNLDSFALTYAVTCMN